MSELEKLKAERDELMDWAFRFDDKPHRLFSFLQKMARGHEHQEEISRLMDVAYYNIHRIGPIPPKSRRRKLLRIAAEQDMRRVNDGCKQ